MLVGDVELDLAAGREDAGAEGLAGRLPHLAAEDDRHLLGAADADVVGDERLEEAPCPPRVVEDERARDLDLAHRQLPPVAAGAVGLAERGRDHRQPAVEEGLHVAGAEPIAERLQPPRLRAAREPVAERGEGNAGALGLPLRPLVAVEPHLRRVREVGAELDEARAELAVVDVKVVDADPPLALLEREVGDARLVGAVAGAEHPLELLRGHDRNHAEATLSLRPLQMGRTWSSLRSSQRRRSGFFRCSTGIPCAAANALTSRRKRLPICANSAGEGTGLPRCPVRNCTT